MKQAARDNSIYVVKGRDLKKATPVKPEKQPVSMDEIILYDRLILNVRFRMGHMDARIIWAFFCTLVRIS